MSALKPRQFWPSNFGPARAQVLIASREIPLLLQPDCWMFVVSGQQVCLFSHLSGPVSLSGKERLPSPERRRGSSVPLPLAVAPSSLSRAPWNGGHGCRSVSRWPSRKSTVGKSRKGCVLKGHHRHAHRLQAVTQGCLHALSLVADWQPPAQPAGMQLAVGTSFPKTARDSYQGPRAHVSC